MKLFRMIALAVSATLAAALPLVAQAQGKSKNRRWPSPLAAKPAFTICR
jgi:hypothetical protein